MLEICRTYYMCNKFAINVELDKSSHKVFFSNDLVFSKKIGT